MIEQITLSEMRAFAAVGQTSSFTDASAQFGRDKTWASKLVARYEGRLGFPVFGRTTRRVYLTIPGRYLLPSVRAAVRFWGTRLEEARTVAQKTQSVWQSDDTVDFKLSHIARIVTVTEARTVTKAAESLHLSKSAVSIQVSRVEDKIGFTLFERNSWMGFQPTPAGEVFISSARAFVFFCNDRHQWAQAEARKRRLSTMDDLREHLAALDAQSM